MEQIVNRFSGKAGSGGAEQPARRGVGEADQSMPVHAADTVGHGVQQNLLLPVEFLGPAAFPGAGQHLSQRRRHCLDGRDRFLIFPQQEVAIELEDGQHLVAQLEPGQPIRKPWSGEGPAGCAGRSDWLRDPRSR